MIRLSAFTSLRRLPCESSRPILLLLFLLLQYLLWLAPGGVLSVWHLRQSVDTQQAENALYRQRNAELIARIDAWKHDHKIIEARARKEFGMIKQGETFYQW